MDSYNGFEPQVGEIQALRTFRIGPGGGLFPLFSDARWRDGANTAGCLRHGPAPGTVPPHAAPDPECTCGFYAYGSETAVADYPHGRHVLAVVACWGRVIAGTRGLRAEHCRVQALWLSDAVPDALRARVQERHPDVVIYRDRSRMLAEHPPTELDCYESAATSGRIWPPRWFPVAVVTAVVAGVLPEAWLGGATTAGTIWAVLGGSFLVAALVHGSRSGDLAARRTELISLGVALWMLAPFAGPAGLLFLRLPLLEVVGVAVIHRRRMINEARRFPSGPADGDQE